jgi:hypothetical protein
MIKSNVIIFVDASNIRLGSSLALMGRRLEEEEDERRWQQQFAAR